MEHQCIRFTGSKLVPTSSLYAMPRAMSLVASLRSLGTFARMAGEAWVSASSSLCGHWRTLYQLAVATASPAPSAFTTVTEIQTPCSSGRTLRCLQSAMRLLSATTLGLVLLRLAHPWVHQPLPKMAWISWSASLSAGAFVEMKSDLQVSAAIMQ